MHVICNVLVYDTEHDMFPHIIRLNRRGILFPSQAHPAEDENHFKTQSPASLPSLLIDLKGQILLHLKSILIFKAMTNLDRMLKSRDITSPTKAHLVKAMVFPEVTYGCESWTIKKAEC